MVQRVHASRRGPAPTRRRVLQLLRSQTPMPPHDVMVGDSDSDVQGSPRYRRRLRLRRMPHDLARPSGDGSGVDRSAFSEVASYYANRNGGKGALHLCKTRNSNTGLCVIYADLAENVVDVGCWWLIGSWATGSTLDGQTVFQVLLNVLQESASIPSCSIAQLVICDELEQCEGVRAGIHMLKRMRETPLRRRVTSGSVEEFVSAVLGDSSNSSDEQETDYPTSPPIEEVDECVEGSFPHPVNGSPVIIGIE